jgi:hypothetical protein
LPVTVSDAAATLERFYARSPGQLGGLRPGDKRFTGPV